MLAWEYKVLFYASLAVAFEHLYFQSVAFAALLDFTVHLSGYNARVCTCTIVTLALINIGHGRPL